MDISAALAQATTAPLPTSLVESIASAPVGTAVSRLSAEDRAKLLSLLGDSIAHEGTNKIQQQLTNLRWVVRMRPGALSACAAGSSEFREQCLAAVVQTWCAAIPWSPMPGPAERPLPGASVRMHPARLLPSCKAFWSAFATSPTLSSPTAASASAQYNQAMRITGNTGVVDWQARPHACALSGGVVRVVRMRDQGCGAAGAAQWVGAGRGGFRRLRVQACNTIQDEATLQ
jgi:hypothetical protein